MQTWTKHHVLLMTVLTLIFAPMTLPPATAQETHNQRLDAIKDWAFSFVRGKGYPDYKKGRKAHDAKNDHQAIAHYERALSRGLDEPYLRYCHHSLGYVYYRQKEAEKAIVHLQRAIDLGLDEPEHHESYSLLGECYDWTEQTQKAIDAYKKSIELFHDFIPPHGNLGAIYYRQGRIKAAAEKFQAVLNLDPQNQEAKAWLEKTNAVIRLKSQPLNENSPYGKYSSRLNRVAGKKLNQSSDEAAFLTWRIDESFPGDLTRRIEGLVAWDDASGAGGTPAIGLPVILFSKDSEKKEVTVAGETTTDEQGYFTFHAPLGIETIFAAKTLWAKNVPDGVRSELERRKPNTD